MGEKFDVNSMTGTAGLSIPIPISPTRAGFVPHLNLSYGSGQGNGPFGLGWQVSLSTITRKTDTGLPTYDDLAESDTVILSSSEDLVPLFKKGRDGEYVRDSRDGRPVYDDRIEDGYAIRRYSPRVGPLASRIERWSAVREPGDVHWRVTDGSNVVSIFGRDENSRIGSGSSSGSCSKRIYSWLLSESYDTKGNAILYSYKAEDSDRVDLHAVNEVHRTHQIRSTNRYLKSVRYGNNTCNRHLSSWIPFSASLLPPNTWRFELVFDYGDHNRDKPMVCPDRSWSCRRDPTSNYRAAFEIRTYRLCRRILMFHHFPDELSEPDYLVRSLDLAYEQNPNITYLMSARMIGYAVEINGSGRHQKAIRHQKALPPLQFEYTRPPVYDPDGDDAVKLCVRDLDPDGDGDLTFGIDDKTYQWIDLDGEGLPGILTEQAGSWYYKRNLSANNMRPVDGSGCRRVTARFEHARQVSARPNATLGSGSQFADVNGDAVADLVQMKNSEAGFYLHGPGRDWESYRTFTQSPVLNLDDPNLKMVDLTGDGRSDILLVGDGTFVWYEFSGESGYAPARIGYMDLDEGEKGPRLVFTDRVEAIFLADCSGDGLSDLCRITNGCISYWPNTGYGTFGAKVVMGNSPWFDTCDQYSADRIRLADVDGSGTTDILYLDQAGIVLFQNQAGNSWSDPIRVPNFPVLDNLSVVSVTDVLGIGTASVVWSTAAPGTPGRLNRYVDLMAGQKPHLLKSMTNNLGAETLITYAPSTEFYLDDLEKGRPWISRLPFPVHCVKQVDLIDQVCGNRFMTLYKYSHGYYDGTEREFRGFGMVEKSDFERVDGTLGSVSSPNISDSTDLPPIVEKSWFHTGAFHAGRHLCPEMAREFFGAPSDIHSAEGHQFLAGLLEQSIIPSGGLTELEQREACRSLKGSMLHQEIYSRTEDSLAPVPYNLTESNYTIRALQKREDVNRYAIFMVHPREALMTTIERVVDDPRLQHTLSLEVDDFGNELKSVSVVYGRRQIDPGLTEEQTKAQQLTEMMYKEVYFTPVIDTEASYSDPMAYQTSTYSIEGSVIQQQHRGSRFSFDHFTREHFAFFSRLDAISFEYEGQLERRGSKRVVEKVKTLYRSDDLSRLLPLGEREPLSLAGASYKLSLTPGLIQNVYNRTPFAGGASQSLIPSPETVLPAGGYVDLDHDGHWWIPSSRTYFDSNRSSHDYKAELMQARRNFFLARRSVDPFGNTLRVDYDEYRQLVIRAEDAVGSTTWAINDYRSLQPRQTTDPNGNVAESLVDELGLTVGGAVAGKPDESLGDSLRGFRQFISKEDMQRFSEKPDQAAAAALLGDASARYIYDLESFYQSQKSRVIRPCFGINLARELHSSESKQSNIQILFSYYDGYGRVIQKKALAQFDPMTQRSHPPGEKQWLGSGWTVFNNKAKPVKEFQPFFDESHQYRADHRVGLSTTKFYDPLQRNIGTLRADHTWTKTTFTPWMQATYDANDTILISDPRADPDVGKQFRALSTEDFLPTWYDARTNGQLGENERLAAVGTAPHADTPTVVHLDSKGRAFVTIIDNGAFGKHTSRIVFDTRGHKRKAVDAKNRVVEMYEYNIMGSIIRNQTMDSGKRWILPDINGSAFVSWDSRDQRVRVVSDALRRPVRRILQDRNGSSKTIEEITYGETQPQPEQCNLRGKVYRGADQSGTITSERYDFKGNILQTVHQLAREFKEIVDWSGEVPLEGERFTMHTQFDALNRPIQLTAPDMSLTRQQYNPLNLVKSIDVRVANSDSEEWKSYLSAVGYNAKGQRTTMRYGNGVISRFTYDGSNNNLTRAYTTRSDGAIQDLTYTLDPMRNMVVIRDDAQVKSHFRGQVVYPQTQFIYDPIYQLVGEHGREHVGSDGDSSIGHLFRLSNSRSDSPENKKVVGNYHMAYTYDSCNNIMSMAYESDDPGRSSRKKKFFYDRSSQVEPAYSGNKLTATRIGKTTETIEYSGYSGLQGSITQTSHLSRLEWDFASRLKATSQQPLLSDGNRPETTWYMYNSAGDRVRKVTERRTTGGSPSGARLKETMYFGGYEVYRTYRGDGRTLKSKRKSLHILDNGKRIALIEMVKKEDESQARRPLIRYQIGNHLDSVTLELDENAKIVSYEEYSSFGSTTFQIGRSDVEAHKRYRFAARERDAETGLYYIGARYYEPSIGRWISSDPDGVADGLNVYCYAHNNPVSLADGDGREVFDPQADLSWLQRKALALDDAINSNPYAKGVWNHAGDRGGKTVEGLSHIPELGQAIRRDPLAVASALVTGTVQLVVDTKDHAIGVGYAYAKMQAEGTDESKEQFAGAITDTWLDVGDIILTIDGANTGINGVAKLAEAGVAGGRAFTSTLASGLRAAPVLAGGVADAANATKVLEHVVFSVGNAAGAGAKAAGAVLKDSETVLPSLANGGVVNATRAAEGFKALQDVFETLGSAVKGGVELHHLFPQKWAGFFKKVGIDIDKYLFGLDPELHHIIHGKKGMLVDMNREWDVYLANNAERLSKMGGPAARGEVLAQGQLLREKYGMAYLNPTEATPAQAAAYAAKRLAKKSQ